MAKQTYQVHVTSSDMKKLLEVQEQQLKHVESISQIILAAKEGERVAQANSGDMKVISPEQKEKVKLDKEELTLQKEQIKLDKESLKTAKELKKIREEEAEAIANIAKSMKTFKSLGDRFDDLKKKMKDVTSPGGAKLAAMKAFNVGGVFNKGIEREKFIKAQQAMGATNADGTEKSRAQLKGDFEQAQKASKAVKKNEADIDEFKKLTGASDSDLGKFKRGRELLEKRQQGTTEYAKYDKRAEMVRRSDEDNTRIQPAPMTAVTAKQLQNSPAESLQKSPTQQFADAGVSEEQAIEDARLMGEQTTLLQKIESNTRGASPDQKAKPKEDEKSSGGLLGGLLGGGKGASILKGLKDFGVGLVLVAGSLWVAAKAFQEFSEVEWGGVMKGMAALGAMVAAAVVLRKASGSLKEVGVGLIAMSAALFITAKALQQFADVNWSDIGKGLIALGGLVLAAMALDKVKGQIIMGGLALGVLALSLWGISEAFQTFADLEWETIGKGMLAVAGIGVIGAIAGSAAPLLIAGGLALGALGAGLWVVGKAMQAVGEGFDKMTAGMEKLAQLDGSNLLKVAAGLAALGPAMALFAAGSVVAGIGNLVTGLLSAVSGQKSPIEQLKEIGDAGEGINKAGSGMQRLGSGMKAFSEVKPETMKQLNDFPWEKVTKFVAAGGSMQADSAKVYNASKQNADEQAKQEGAKPAGNTTVVNAPVNNNTTQNQTIRSPIRNQESTQSRYIGGRFATF